MTAPKQPAIPALPVVKANHVSVGSNSMLSFALEPSIPPNEIHLRLDGKTVGKIINLATETQPAIPATTEGDV